ncbi:MAG: hypothetical protein ORN28_07150 [Rhodoferax sp.]|nr:hypothetical protein [Rhodoferax sp.]
MQSEALSAKKQRLVSGGLKLSIRLVATLTAALILVAVFLLYTRPEFLLDMGNQVWGCF